MHAHARARVLRTSACCALVPSLCLRSRTSPIGSVEPTVPCGGFRLVGGLHALFASRALSCLSAVPSSLWSFGLAIRGGFGSKTVLPSGHNGRLTTIGHLRINYPLSSSTSLGNQLETISPLPFLLRVVSLVLSVLHNELYFSLKHACEPTFPQSSWRANQQMTRRESENFFT